MIKKIGLRPIDLFFSIMLVELFMGGGGRLSSFNNITLRMILFSSALCWFIIKLVQKKEIGKTELILTGFFLLITAWSTFWGLLHHAGLSIVLLDVKQQVFFLSILYFSFYIDSMEKIERITALVKYTSLFLAITYLITILLVQFKIVAFDPFYDYLNQESFYTEFMFRGDKGYFFYKGFFYLSIGLFFFLFDNSTHWNKVFAAIIFIALFLTLLRWLLLTTLFVYAIYIGIDFIYKRWKMSYSHVINLVLMAAFVKSFGQFFIVTLGDKSMGDDIRGLQVKQVYESITLGSFIWGHGFGIGVPIRPVHMEYMYLEIFHKQGILGILFWLILLSCCCYYFFKGYSIKNETIIVPFFLSVLIVFIQSISNPFLINPIGLSITIISFVCLKYYLTFTKLKSV